MILLIRVQTQSIIQTCPPVFFVSLPREQLHFSEIEIVLKKYYACIVNIPIIILNLSCVIKKNKSYENISLHQSRS
jgi:hypothetical protein